MEMNFIIQYFLMLQLNPMLLKRLFRFLFNKEDFRDTKIEKDAHLKNINARWICYKFRDVMKK